MTTDSELAICKPDALPVPSTFLFADSVQEVLTKNPGQVPENYIRSPDEIPMAILPSPEDEFPVIDMGNLVNGDDGIRERELRKLGKACEEWGFFHVINHGVPCTLTERTLGVMKDFFKLSHEEKMKYARKPGGMDGYGVTNLVYEDQKRDWGDHLGMFVLPEHNITPAYWPSHPQDFSETIQSFAMQAKGLADELFKAIAETLGLDKGYFDERIGKNGVMYVSGNLYPVCPRPDLVAGLSAHADGNAITLLLQDDYCTGLHVFHHEKWFAVPPLKGSIVINVGDQLEAMSNGKYESVNHRAVPNSAVDRMSVAAFYLQDFDALVEPAAKLVEETGKARYKSYILKDFLAVNVTNPLNNKRVFHEFAKLD